MRLGQHRFADAYALARDLNKQAPDDVMVYGLLTDASVELGRYDEAEKSAQWMLDMRPGNVPGLTRAAYLRELFGDLEGARELMQMAPRADAARARARTGPGSSRRSATSTCSRARPPGPSASLDEALRLFPGYHYALGGLARVRTAQGRHAEAVELLRQRQAAADHPENLYELAEALERAGRKREARAAFAEFEKAARAESAGPDNANRELVFYYTDHAGRPDEALRIAAAEAASRQDVYTLDAHAWALWAKGRRGEARATLQEGARGGRPGSPGAGARARARGPAARYGRGERGAQMTSSVWTELLQELLEVSRPARLIRSRHNGSSARTLNGAGAPSSRGRSASARRKRLLHRELRHLLHRPREVGVLEAAVVHVRRVVREVDAVEDAVLHRELERVHVVAEGLVVVQGELLRLVAQACGGGRRSPGCSRPGPTGAGS